VDPSTAVSLDDLGKSITVCVRERLAIGIDMRAAQRFEDPRLEPTFDSKRDDGPANLLRATRAVEWWPDRRSEEDLPETKVRNDIKTEDNTKVCHDSGSIVCVELDGRGEDRLSSRARVPDEKHLPS
jgi:hypothetical protein